MHITNTTTLGELCAARAALRIDFLSLHHDARTRNYVASIMADGSPLLYGHGTTSHEAINHVFEQRRQALGLPPITNPQVEFQINSSSSSPYVAPPSSGTFVKCNVPMCGDSGVCDECRRRGAR